MTFIIIFFVTGFNILLSQQNCYNLDFANKSWYKRDSVVSVQNIPNKFKVKLNEKSIHNIAYDGEIIDFIIYDILGKKIPFELKNNLKELNIIINDELIKNKLILITFSIINKNGIKYYTIKQYLD